MAKNRPTRKAYQPPKPALPKAQLAPVLGKPSTIALSIIVKNESKVIERMLNTVWPILDYYSVIDTGSTDGTQDIIRKFFESKGIPGQVIDHPWKNFEDARNTALASVKGKADFGFWIDADEQLIIDPKFNINLFKQNLSRFSGANLKVSYGSQNYYRMQFFRTESPWRWYGPVHEVLVNDATSDLPIGEAEGLIALVTPDGNSWTSESQQQKYEGHAKILLDYVENDPKRDPRWVFYLAQSYRDAGTPENQKKAIEWYAKRASIINEGFWEEVYWSQLMVASMKGHLQYPVEEILDEYSDNFKINLYYLDEFLCKIIVRRIDKNEGWGKNLRILLNSLDKKSSEIISIGSSDYQSKIIEIYKKERTVEVEVSNINSVYYIEFLNIFIT
jgi:glycosyltransferase involved in cell wall biosynthesis